MVPRGIFALSRISGPARGRRFRDWIGYEDLSPVPATSHLCHSELHLTRGPSPRMAALVEPSSGAMLDLNDSVDARPHHMFASTRPKLLSISIKHLLMLQNDHPVARHKIFTVRISRTGMGDQRERKRTRAFRNSFR